ncbi:MAG: M20/M25/M40 family metallo-hydrolase, partial [Alphaproteobacteria bacterium]|nr:M20/M25/M40 family metallo-hydrolase [Alphaproteobacteria bacterium]
MPVNNRIADMKPEMAEWRQDIHAHPELAFEEHRTAKVVAAKLKEFGIEVHEGLAVTGVVGTLKGTGDGPAIAIRADMDALALQETTGLDYQSTHDGKMHACGHDGHTT